MALNAFPRETQLCSNGCRALEWILDAGGNAVSKSMVDEGVLPICTELLRCQKDVDCVRSVCGVVSKICRHGGRGEK